MVNVSRLRLSFTVELGRLLHDALFTLTEVGAADMVLVIGEMKAVGFSKRPSDVMNTGECGDFDLEGRVLSRLIAGPTFSLSSSSPHPGVELMYPGVLVPDPGVTHAAPGVKLTPSYIASKQSMEVLGFPGVAEAIPFFKTIGDSNILRFLALIRLMGVAGLFSFISMM